MAKGPIPPNERFGMSCAEAAAYIGVSRPYFERLVEVGRFPQPKEVGGRLIWSRSAVERAFEALPSRRKAESRFGGDVEES